METKELEEKLLRPLLYTSKKFYFFVGLLILFIGWFAFAWIYQLRNGLVVTGMRDIPGGAPWGVYITNFIFWIGISHAGIAIAAGIRLLKLHRYIAVARIAELATIFSLMMAGLSIIMDMGRPDRIFNLILNYPSRLPTSPLVWDVTAIGTYLITSAAYLYIELRGDLARLMGRVKWKWLYRLLLFGYEADERGRIERVIFYASIFIIAIMVMVHTTVAWIFGLMVSRPGWYATMLGPYFVLGAILSGIAAVVVLAGIYRRVFHWEEILTPTVFRGLGRVLSWFTILYIYFLLAEFMTVMFAGPTGELTIWTVLTQGRFAPLFWLQAGALVVAFAIFFINTLFPKVFRVWTTIFASALVVVALWITRFVIVVPSLTHPYLPYRMGSYTPTWVEWSLVGGTFAIVTLFYTLFTKFFPVISLTEIERAGEVE